MSSSITTKILLTLAAVVLAAAGVVAYRTHQVREYERRYENGMRELNIQKPASNYTLP